MSFSKNIKSLPLTACFFFSRLSPDNFYEWEKKMKIGMLIAVEIEAFISEYKGQYTKDEIHGFAVYKVKVNQAEIFAIHSGAGQVFAAAATMLLINEFKVEFIINYGVVGSLTGSVKTFDACLVEKIVHYSFDTSEIDNCEVGRHLEYDSIYIPTNKELINIAHQVDAGLKLVCCASGDKFVGSPEEKHELHKKFNADICEMEAAAIILIANKAKVPCLFVKTVSDSIEGGASEFSNTLSRCSNLCMNIVKQLILFLK